MAKPEYQNKHPRAIHLDTYHGVACDLMELNYPVADRFMQVSDMRGDVVIIQKPQDRVRDYDEVGFVRVAKVLKLPRLDLWKRENSLLQTRKEGDSWIIAVNDQELADKVARDNGNNKRFDDRFIEVFREEVKRGLTSCLKREKLLNDGRYNFGFLVAYHGFVSYDLVLGVPLLAYSVLEAKPELALVAIAFTAGANTVVNGIELGYVGMNWAMEKIFGPALDDHEVPGLPSFLQQYLKGPKFNDPFIRHSYADIIMPPVPVDRLARGLYYLNQHGQDLIETGQKTRE